MNKIKISEVTFNTGIAYHNDQVIDLVNKELHQIIDFEHEKLECILFKELYRCSPTEMLLDNMIYTKCLASLLGLQIIEDETIIKEAHDLGEVFNHTLCNNLKGLFGFSTELYNSYGMHYDVEKLKKEENGSFTLHGVECIQSNKRTTNYFRDFLMLHNSERNVLVLNPYDNLINHFDNHKSAKYTFNVNNDDAIEVIYDLVAREDVTLLEAFNMKLASLFTDNERYINDIKWLMGSVKKNYNNTYLDPYFELVELKAKKTKCPSLLFNELMEYGTSADIQLGLIHLGFDNNVDL